MSVEINPNLNVSIKFRPQGNSAFYYLMKNGYILRVEEAFNDSNVPLMIKANMIDSTPLNQDQANYRVAIFRDEILEMIEYQERVFGYAS